MSKTLLDHIAIAVERIGDAPAVLVGALGGRPAYGAPSADFNFGQWRYDGGGRIEIIEPAGTDGFLHRFLAQRGPGVHHVTFKVPDVYESRDRARTHGYDIIGFDDSLAEWKTFFLHPRQALGIVVQVAQASGHGPRSWTPPPGPSSVPPAVHLLGLRARARTRERADTQWTTVLMGERTDATATELVYRWPGSPLRIVVELDASADEGPIAIEYASDRVALPPTPAPGLGTVFTRVIGDTR
jgi:glyoxalase/bleomycin resistance protein/dioxygenase superfamily protein